MQYYKHYKGNIYKFLAEARHSETQEEMIVYEAMYGEHQIWVRPKQMFFEQVELPNGQKVRRFTPCAEPSNYDAEIAEATSVLLPLFKQKGYNAEDFSGGCSLCGERNDFALDIIDMRLSDLFPKLDNAQREIIATQVYDNIYSLLQQDEL